MESQIQAQVLGVSSRQSRNGQHTMYDVQLSDGQKYTTFDPDLAQQAAQLQGQNVAANVSLEQNGKYLNRNLLAIGAPGTLPAPVPQAGAVAIPAAQPVAGTPGVITPAPSGGGGGGMSIEDKARITRLSAAGTAFDFVSRLFAGAGPEAGKQATEIARALTETLVNYGHNGAWQGVPATPAAIAQAVPGVQVGVEGIQQGEAQAAAPAAEPTAAVAAQGDDIPWD